MVSQMAASEFVRFLKSAKMIQAEQRQIDIESASFPYFKDDHREKVMRDLRKAAKQYLFEPLVDFKDFAASIARAMTNG